MLTTDFRSLNDIIFESEKDKLFLEQFKFTEDDIYMTELSILEMLKTGIESYQYPVLSYIRAIYIYQVIQRYISTTVAVDVYDSCNISFLMNEAGNLISTIYIIPNSKEAIKSLQELVNTINTPEDIIITISEYNARMQ